MKNKKWFIPGSVKGGWIEDDNAEFILPVFVQYSYDKEKPGVWIEILKDEENNS